MKALVWNGTKNVSVEDVPEPTILNPRDAIVKIMTTSICGSDVDIYNGSVPAMEAGDILGHEFMGDVVEVGKDVKNLKKGDRVVVPFVIACGGCFFCKHELFSLCDNSNPNAAMLEKLYGQSSAGLFGYSHLYGGYAGGQAQYARVPFADVGPIRICDDSLSDEKVVLLADTLPTAWQAAENCGIEPGDTVAVWGCGPVGQLAILSAFLQGAERVIALDQIPHRLELARRKSDAETLDFSDSDLQQKLREMTAGRGPDCCIDTAGMESTGATLDALYDRAMQALMLDSNRPHPLTQAIQACRKGGTVSIAGGHARFVDRFPLAAAFAKGLTLKMGQTNVHRYMRPLLEKIECGEIDPSFVITHSVKLDDAAEAYLNLASETGGCNKIALKPW
jgi:threonine dehydrogenase-like Zn-dependent dehydrogenase